MQHVNVDASDNAAVVASVVDEGDKGGGADGLESGADGRIYATNFEHNAILRWGTDGLWETIAHDSRLLWPDTMSLATNGYLYVTANQLHRQARYHEGRDLREKPYTLFRLHVGAQPVLLRLSPKTDDVSACVGIGSRARQAFGRSVSPVARCRLALETEEHRAQAQVMAHRRAKPVLTPGRSPQRAATGKDTGRIEAFSDAVLAIIITLLVLDLRPPAIEAGQLLPELIRRWPAYLAYVTSFLYVAVIWFNHNATFRRVRKTNRALQWANFGVLFMTALLPFATVVLAQALQTGNLFDERVAVGLYALVGSTRTLIWSVLFHYLSRHEELVMPGVDQGFFAQARLRALTGVVLYAGAGFLGWLIAPWFGLVAFFALAIFYAVTSEGHIDASSNVSRTSSD